MKKQILIVSSAASLLLSCGMNVKLGESPMAAVLDSLTLDEKLHLVIGDRLDVASTGAAVVGMTKKYVPGAAGNTFEIKRLGITPAILADGPAGLRIDATRENDKNTYYCTHFPIATLLASTWNTPLVETVGTAIGTEAKEYGCDVLLAPAINIHRNPLCGRNFEYFSEDPLLTGKMGAAYIRGVQSTGVGTSLKHFALNNQETNRQHNNVIVSQQAMREIYLKGFEIAVREGKPWTVMSSYNRINGEYASESKSLLTTILRDEWGFDGIVMTDWFGGNNPVWQMEAGNDLLMPGRKQQYDNLKASIKNGTFTEKQLDVNVQRILELVIRTPRFNGYKYSNKPNLKENADISRNSATEGIVLLKNKDNTLPFSPNIKTVALYGCTSYSFIAGGSGSGNVNRAYTVSLLDGLNHTGIKTDAEWKRRYETYIEEMNRKAPKPTGPFARFLSIPLPKEMIPTKIEMEELAKKSDIGIITLGRLSGEFTDRSLTDFNLSTEEHTLINQVCDVFHAQNKKVVVILNIGGVIETASWKDMPDAILCVWQAGQEGGNSVTDILTGKVSPSGRLPMTFPNRYEDTPSAANFVTDAPQITFNRENDAEVLPTHRKNIDFTNYEEDIFVGYRYYDTFNKEVSYPFGYGLSYTHFAYEDTRVSKSGDNIVVELKVRNTGKVSGKEVVQLYATAPHQTRLSKPSKELKAFVKTSLLKPNATETVTLRFKQQDLASFDESQSAWVVDGGNYILHIGSSSRDIRSTLTVPVNASLKKVANVLKRTKEINLLKVNTSSSPSNGG